MNLNLKLCTHTYMNHTKITAGNSAKGPPSIGIWIRHGSNPEQLSGNVTKPWQQLCELWSFWSFLHTNEVSDEGRDSADYKAVRLIAVGQKLHELAAEEYKQTNKSWSLTSAALCSTVLFHLIKTRQSPLLWLDFRLKWIVKVLLVPWRQKEFHREVFTLHIMFSVSLLFRSPWGFFLYSPYDWHRGQNGQMVSWHRYQRDTAVAQGARCVLAMLCFIYLSCI